MTGVHAELGGSRQFGSEIWLVTAPIEASQLSVLKSEPVMIIIIKKRKMGLEVGMKRKKKKKKMG